MRTVPSPHSSRIPTPATSGAAIPLLLLAALALLVSLSAFAGETVPATTESRGPDAPAESAADGNWPQFRGPGGLGVAEDVDVPLRWSADENLLWKTAIEGLGHSSPIVWGEHIFVTTALDGEPIPGAQAPVHRFGGDEFKHPQAVGADKSHTMKVVALNARTGEVVWTRTAYEGRVYDDRHSASSYASPTPATDGERVYAYFGSEGVYAYDLGGTLVWQRDIGDIKTVGLGVGTSPVLFRDLVLIQADEDEGKESFLVALDRKTGAEVWRVPRPVQASWTTPLVVRDPGGREQLVTAGNELLLAYDPATGQEIWRAKGLDSNAIHTPLIDGDKVVFTAGYPTKNIIAVRLGKTGDLSGSENVVWTYAKGTAYVPSNLLYDGRLYLISDGGVLTCLDPQTGAVVYEGGRFPEAGKFMASPIAISGKLLLVNTDGVAAFVKAGPVHEVLGQSDLDEPVYATPAVSRGRLYIRGERHLFAIGKTGS